MLDNVPGSAMDDVNILLTHVSLNSKHFHGNGHQVTRVPSIMSYRPGKRREEDRKGKNQPFQVRTFNGGNRTYDLEVGSKRQQCHSSYR
ncbi:hypothetical protein WDU94_010254 [Cyamophila willieti]